MKKIKNKKENKVSRWRGKRKKEKEKKGGSVCECVDISNKKVDVVVTVAMLLQDSV